MNESRPQCWPYLLLGCVGGSAGLVFLCTICLFGSFALLGLLAPNFGVKAIVLRIDSPGCKLQRPIDLRF